MQGVRRELCGYCNCIGASGTDASHAWATRRPRPSCTSLSFLYFTVLLVAPLYEHPIATCSIPPLYMQGVCNMSLGAGLYTLCIVPKEISNVTACDGPDDDEFRRHHGEHVPQVLHAHLQGSSGGQVWPLVKVCRISYKWKLLEGGAVLVDLPGGSVRYAGTCRLMSTCLCVHGVSLRVMSCEVLWMCLPGHSM